MCMYLFYRAKLRQNERSAKRKRKKSENKGPLWALPQLPGTRSHWIPDFPPQADTARSSAFCPSRTIKSFLFIVTQPNEVPSFFFSFHLPPAHQSANRRSPSQQTPSGNRHNTASVSIRRNGGRTKTDFRRAESQHTSSLQI